MKSAERQITEEFEVPSASMLDRHQIEAAYFQDSYRVLLSRSQASIADIFLGIFAHHPLWMKFMLIIRNRIARWFGLDGASASEIINVETKNSYKVGEKIGVWPILALTENELIAGRDDKHLDFRLSVLKIIDGETASVVVTTICIVNNTFGKVYLFFIVPFHKWGVQKIMSNAVTAGRL